VTRVGKVDKSALRRDVAARMAQEQPAHASDAAAPGIAKEGA
jgi:hypothetical protein